MRWNYEAVEEEPGRAVLTGLSALALVRCGQIIGNALTGVGTSITQATWLPTNAAPIIGALAGALMRALGVV